MKLRAYQQDLCDEVETLWEQGVRNVGVSMATGGGKTVVFSHLQQQFLNKNRGFCVSVAHRQELVGQMSLALARFGIRHNILAPKSVVKDICQEHRLQLGSVFYSPTSRAVVAGVDTVIRRSEPWFANVGQWVVDEAHHVLKGNKWGKVAGLFPNARGLGVTATWERADGKGLGAHADGVFEHVVSGPCGEDLIARGFLSKYRILLPKTHVDISSVPTTAGGDFNLDALGEAVKKSTLVGDMVKHYRLHAAGKAAIVFTVNVEEAARTAQAFRQDGWAFEAITSKTPEVARNALIRKFRNREIQGLVNVGLFDEGFDVPGVEVVIMGRHTESFPLYSQQFGRGLRTFEGKEYCLVIDHVSNFYRLGGAPTFPRPLCLSRRESVGRGKVERTITYRTCDNPQCLSPYDRVLRTCPYCGLAYTPKERGTPEQVDGDLCELDPEVVRQLTLAMQKVDAEPQVSAYWTPVVQHSVVKNHRLRREAQMELRKSMAAWAGAISSDTSADTVRALQRRFYVTFGVDVLTAQGLGTADARELKIKIDQKVSGGIRCVE